MLLLWRLCQRLPDQLSGAYRDMDRDIPGVQGVRHLHQDLPRGCLGGQGMKYDVVVVGAGPAGSMAIY